MAIGYREASIPLSYLSPRNEPIGYSIDLCRAIVDATADSVCCFKPQIAYFAARREEQALERLIAHIHAVHPGIPVILDAKRGDIGATADSGRARSTNVSMPTSVNGRRAAL